MLTVIEDCDVINMMQESKQPRKPWTSEEDEMIWAKAHIIDGEDPDVWRMDDYGYVIKRDQHAPGWRCDPYGWHKHHDYVDGDFVDDVEHVRPVHREPHYKLTFGHDDTRC